MHLLCTVCALSGAGCNESWRTEDPQLSSSIGGSREAPKCPLKVPGLQAGSPAALMSSGVA
jgi:hypothetical protein